MMPVLADFMERLELPNPPMVLREAERFLPSVESWLADQEIGPDDMTWLLTRMGYFIGELLVQKFGGCWFVNDAVNSRYFVRYVVGRFTGVKVLRAVIDPFEVAAHYLSQPTGRRLTPVLREVETELMGKE
jgi:hypothetical protein